MIKTINSKLIKALFSKSILIGAVLAMVVGVAGMNISKAATSTDAKTVSSTPLYVKDIESVKVNPKLIFSNVAVKDGSASEYYHSAEPNKTWWSGSKNSLYVVESNSANGGSEYSGDYPVISSGFPLAVSHTFGTQAEKPYIAAMVYDSGKSLDIYFPAFKPENPNTKKFYFYVADDGSTYYGDKENDGINDIQKELLTVGEAMVPEHLARTARDIITPCKNYQPVSFFNLYKEPKIDEGRSTVYYPSSYDTVNTNPYGTMQNIGVRYSLSDSTATYTLERKVGTGSWTAVKDLHYDSNISSYIYPDKINPSPTTKEYQYRIKAQTKDCNLAYSNTIIRTPNPFQWRLDYFNAKRDKISGNVTLNWSIKNGVSSTENPEYVIVGIFRTGQDGYIKRTILDTSNGSRNNISGSFIDVETNKYENYSYLVKILRPNTAKEYGPEAIYNNEYIAIEQANGKDIVKVDALVSPPPPPPPPDPKVNISLASNPSEIIFGDNFALTVASKNLPKGKVTCYLPFGGGNTVVSSDCSEIKFEAKQANGEIYYDGLGKESGYQTKKLVTIGLSVAVNKQIVGEATTQITVNPPKPKPLPQISNASGKWVVPGLNLRSLFGNAPKYPDKAIELTWTQSPQDIGSEVVVSRIDTKPVEIFRGKVSSPNGFASELNPGVYDNHIYSVQVVRSNEKGSETKITVPALEKKILEPVAPETFTATLELSPTLIKTDALPSHVRLDWSFKEKPLTGDVSITRSTIADGKLTGQPTTIADKIPAKQIDFTTDNPDIGNYRYSLVVANREGKQTIPKTIDIAIEKPVPPVSPTDLQAKWNIEKNPAQLVVSWVQPNSKIKISQYQVELLTDASTVSSQMIAGSTRSIAFSEDPTQKYAVRLSALGQNGLSSTPIEIDIKPVVTKPLPLTNGSAGWLDRSIIDRINGKPAKLELTWNKSGDRFYKIDYYEIYRYRIHTSDATMDFLLGKTLENNYIVELPDEKGNEIYQIVGVTTKGAKTDPLTIHSDPKTDDVIPIPTTIAVKPGDTTAEINWTFDREYSVYQEIIRKNINTNEEITIATIKDGAKKSNTYTDNSVPAGEYIYQIITKEIGGLGRQSQPKFSENVVVAPAPKTPQTKAQQNDDGAVQIVIVQPIDADIITKVEILRSQDRINFETIAVSGGIITQFIDQDPLIIEGEQKTVYYKVVYNSSFNKKTETEPLPVAVIPLTKPDDGRYFKATGAWVAGTDEPQIGFFKNLFTDPPVYLTPPEPKNYAIKITWNSQDKLDIFRVGVNGQRTKINDEPITSGYVYDHSASPVQDTVYEVTYRDSSQNIIVKKTALSGGDEPPGTGGDTPVIDQPGDEDEHTYDPVLVLNDILDSLLSDDSPIVTEPGGLNDKILVFNTEKFLDVPAPESLKGADQFSTEAWMYSNIDHDGMFPIAQPSTDWATYTWGIYHGSSCRDPECVSFYVMPEGSEDIKNANDYQKLVRYINSTPYEINKWHQVIATYDGAKSVLYVDGQPMVERTDKKRPVVFSEMPIRLGGLQVGQWPKGFDGKIDDFRLYDKAINASQVLDRYNQTKGKYNSGSTEPPPDVPGGGGGIYTPIIPGDIGTGDIEVDPPSRQLLSNLIALVGARNTTAKGKYFAALTATSQINFIRINESDGLATFTKIADLDNPVTVDTSTWGKINNLRQDSDGIWHVVYPDGKTLYYIRSQDNLGTSWDKPTALTDQLDNEDKSDNVPKNETISRNLWSYNILDQSGTLGVYGRKSTDAKAKPVLVREVSKTGSLTNQRVTILSKEISRQRYNTSVTTTENTIHSIFTENSSSDAHASPKDLVYERVGSDDSTVTEAITGTGSGDLGQIFTKSNGTLAIVGWDSSTDIGGIFYQEGSFESWSDKTLLVNNGDSKGLLGGSNLDASLDSSDNLVVTWLGRDNIIHYIRRASDGTLSEIKDVKTVSSIVSPKIASNSVAVAASESLIIYPDSGSPYAVTPKLCGEDNPVDRYEAWVNGKKYQDLKSTDIDIIGLTAGDYKVFVRTYYCDGSYVDSSESNLKISGTTSKPTELPKLSMVEVTKKENQKDSILLPSPNNQVQKTIPTVVGVLAGIGLLASIAVPVALAISNSLLSATTGSIASGAMTSTASASVASATSAVSGLAGVAGGAANMIINPLRYLLFAWLPKRKRKSWGEVKSKDTNSIISNAYVRLISKDLERSVSQELSDDKGSFSFSIRKPGTYQISVYANGYKPYFSSEFNIKNLNFQPDPVDVKLEFAEASQHMEKINTVLSVIKVSKILVKMKTPILVLGSLLSVYNALAIGGNWAWISLGFYGVLWFLEIILRMQPHPNGTVIDKKTNQPIDRVIVRLFNLKDNNQELIATSVTNESGQFEFIAAQGEYLVTATRVGYDNYQSEKILLKKQSGIKIKIGLVSNGQGSQSRDS